MTATELPTGAEALLAQLAGPGARLRPDQAAAIEAVVGRRQRVLVVQRTGWGKSAVYFIATRLLREAGAGPTLLVSPLLALMRNQLEAARRIGVRAETINSTNVEGWREVERAVAANEVDLLCISPERLNNPGFRAEVLPGLARSVGLLVVDEAHCVSDWGHDFRPDYRRIAAVLAELGEDVPVLCTTATANERVVADVSEQLGGDPVTLRGPLGRDSLALSVVTLPDAGERLAWLAEHVSAAPGSGIVYCLTVAATEQVASWLRQQGVDAVAYSGATEAAERERVEAALLAGEVKAVVATSALGMGFDKPDLAFVVHLGMPPSPIAYYQQVGRAGRALDAATAVLVPTPEDAHVWAWFESTALPPEPQVNAVLRALERAPRPLPVTALEEAVNLRRTRLEGLLKVLDVEGAVERVQGGWARTEQPWAYDGERIERVRAARRVEQEAMVRYARAESCLMAFLRHQLDDAEAEPCGRCGPCTGAGPPPPPDPATVAAAGTALGRADVAVEPRRQWPSGLGEPKGRIPPERQAERGRALAASGDAAWSAVVAPLLAPGDGASGVDPGGGADGPVPDEVVRAALGVLKRWDWGQRPSWVTWVPSRARPRLVEELARRIAEAGRLPLHAVLRRTLDHPPQAGMDNSAHQVRNVWGAFAVDEGALPRPGVLEGPVLLVDDVTRSGWTLTVTAALLRQAGAPAVLPLVLERR